MDALKSKTIAFGGAKLNVGGYGRQLLEAIRSPKKFYDAEYAQISSSTIYLGFGLSLATAMLSQLIAYLPARHLIGASMWVMTPIFTLVFLAIFAGMVLGFNSIFVRQPLTVKAVAKWTAFISTPLMLASVVTNLLSLAGSSWILSLLPGLLAIYLIVTGAQHALNFSKGQAYGFVAVPVGIGSITTMCFVLLFSVISSATSEVSAFAKALEEAANQANKATDD